MPVPARPLARRMADSSDSSAYTTKEIALQLQAELRAYISAHEARHNSEQQGDYASRTDPNATATGRILQAAQADLTKDLADLALTVKSHERSIQRLIGATALIIFLGGGAFVLAALSTAGRLLGIPVP